MTRLKITILISLLVLAVATPVFGSETNGTIDPLFKYAWGENVGWINCAPTSTGDVYNGLNITEAAVTGYAWSTAGGWINFAPTNGGVTNDASGTLGGYAWSSQKGWITMAGITIDPDGKFVGTAGTLGTTSGRVTFSCDNCDVRTDWRPVPVCTDWTYSDWGSCLDSQQTRVVLTSSPPGCIGGRPTLSQTCSSGGGGGGGSHTPFIAVKRADIVKDGVVDILDFNALMVNWGKRGLGIVADINQSGEVDIFDFNLLMIYWGRSMVHI